MKHWFEENPQLFEEVRNSISKGFPTFNVVIEHEYIFIRGSLLILDEEEIEIDRYSIEIKLPSDYPVSVPIVREIGGRIPRSWEGTGDRHLFTNGNCCLFVREEKWKYYPVGTSIVDFIRNIVTNYFLNQTNYELTGSWLWGERRHGVYGIIDFYKEELKTEDLGLIIRFIQYLAKATLKSYRICYCGSKKKLQNCHFRTLRNFRGKISPEIAKDSLLLMHEELERFENLRRVTV